MIAKWAQRVNRYKDKYWCESERVCESVSECAMNIHEYYAIIKGKTPSVVSSSSSTQTANTWVQVCAPLFSLFQLFHSSSLAPSRPCQHRIASSRTGFALVCLVSASHWAWAWACVWAWVLGLGLGLEFISAFQSPVRRACCFSCLH